MKVIESENEWTVITPTISMRIWRGKVWRKEFNEAYYAGYQIKTIPLGAKIADEWLSFAGHNDVRATASAEVANMIDPSGELRRAGLLSVQA